MTGSTRRLFWAAGLFALLIAVAVMVENSQFSRAKRQFQTQAVPAEMLDGSATGRLFRQLGLLNVIPNHGDRFKPSVPGRLDWGQGLFPRRRQVGLHLYSTEAMSAAELLSTTVMDPAVLASGLPIVSLYVLPRDLHDPERGLYHHVVEKGRKWERQAFVSYFDGGRLVFGSGVGLRLHGGYARHLPRKSFRLLFRADYGQPAFPPGVLFSDGIEPVTAFVLDADNGDAKQLIDPVALDVARMIGAIAPETRLVRLFLNGAAMGTYVAMEHVSRRYMRAHYGHDNFTMVRSKHFEKVSGEGYDYWLFHLWVKQNDFTMAELAQRVDVENFARWVISTLLNLTVDHDQGPVLRDDSVPGGRWFYINWDMDNSFGLDGRMGPRPWESDQVPVIGLGTTRQTMMLRLHNDPRWRAYFTRLFVDVLNHQFTPTRVEQLLQHYEATVERFELGEPGRRVMAVIRKVLEHRPEVMRSWLRKTYDLAPAHKVTVSAPPGVDLHIDGYTYRGPYVGWYFADMPVTVSAGEKSDAMAWRVNGKRIAQAQLRLATIARDTVIESVTVGR